MYDRLTIINYNTIVEHIIREINDSAIDSQELKVVK